jgi:hypothetical protein
MEHIHLAVNFANESSSNQISVIPNTSIFLKINKALLISKKEKAIFGEEFYKYAIELKINDESWCVFRRFSEIRDEHERMSKKYSNLRKETFPSRSPFNKTDSFQIERQQKLEQYLKTYIQTVLGDSIYDFMPNVKLAGSSNKQMKLNREEFCNALPFFIETTEDKLNVQKLGWKTADN